MSGKERNELDESHSSGDDEKAKKAVENLKVALWEVADVYGIPKHVLFSKKEPSTENKIEITNIFTFNQEEHLKRDLVERGPADLSACFIRKAAYTFAQAHKIPHNFDHTTGMASRAWFRAFIQRNPDIYCRQDDDSDNDVLTSRDKRSNTNGFKESIRGRKKWSADDTSNLIDVYKSFPVLWDPKYSNEKYQERKAVVWKDIATRFNTSILKVRHKMKQVFLDYINEKKKFENADRIENFIFESKLFAFTRLNFLESLNIDYNLEQVNENQTTYNSSSDSSSDYDLSVFSGQEQRGNTNRGKKRRHLRSGSRMKKLLKIENIASESDSSKNEEDTFEVFGELVAKKIRNLPTEYSQNAVQRLIHDILCDGEMGIYNDEESHEEQIALEQSD